MSCNIIFLEDGIKDLLIGIGFIPGFLMVCTINTTFNLECMLLIMMLLLLGFIIWSSFVYRSECNATGDYHFAIKRVQTTV